MQTLKNCELNLLFSIYKRVKEETTTRAINYTQRCCSTISQHSLVLEHCGTFFILQFNKTWQKSGRAKNNGGGV